jgi:hypothetical protein
MEGRLLAFPGGKMGKFLVICRRWGFGNGMNSGPSAFDGKCGVNCLVMTLTPPPTNIIHEDSENILPPSCTPRSN